MKHVGDRGDKCVVINRLVQKTLDRQEVAGPVVSIPMSRKQVQ